MESIKNKKLPRGSKLILVIVCVAAVSLLIKGAVMIIGSYINNKEQNEIVLGIENYNKKSLYKKYGSKLDCEMLIFPDNIENMYEPKYEFNLKSGIFDTEGYIILQARYDEEHYQKEVDRLSQIDYEVSDIILGVRYDEKTYRLPAYIAMDGYNSVYEYALVDAKEYEIIYIILSYPDLDKLDEYEKYLKIDIDKYKEEITWDRFSIYARHFEDGEYVEYSDGEE